MQQRNYQREMDALIASLDARPRLLLHSCCGPCSSACLERLAPHFDIDVFFYNPNILPAEEWEKRLFWQKHLLETAPFGKNVGLIVPERDETAFRLAAAGLEAEAEGGARCTECFVLRLSRTAEAAREGGYDYFATTLTVSPHKNAPLINAIGEKLTAFCGCRRISKSATATAAALNFRTNTDCTARAGAAAVCPRILKYHHRKRYLVLNSNDLREKLIIPAVVGALYAALTMLLAPISYGNLQFRISEALCVLPVFFPYTSVGLFLGCALANMISAAGILDVVFGSLATLCAGLCAAACGREARRTGAMPSAAMRVLACLSPVVWNGVVIGAVLAWSFARDAFLQSFLLFGAEVALGEAGVLFLLGMPLISLIPRIFHLERKNAA